MADFNQLVLPYSLEAEQTILGAMLIKPDVLSVVTAQIKAECFFITQHQELFTLMLRIFANNGHIDVVTVLDAAISRKVFDTSEEGKAYLAGLVESVPSTANVPSYCRIVLEKYYIRSLAQSCRDVLELIQDGETDTELLFETAEQSIFNIRQEKQTGGLVPIGEVVTEEYHHIGCIAGPDREKYVGIKSGFPSLDALISGLNRSDLILIAARPAMGKTAFALNIAENVAKANRKKKVCIFSLEMSKEQLAARFLSSAAEVESHKLRNGRLLGDDWSRLAIGVSYLQDKPIYIDDTGGITVPQMKSRLRRIRNLGLVIIDYLGLISSTMRTENKVQIVTEITRQLKMMAKELDVPVILLSQLSRGPESRTDKRPMLSDLRDSGAIEQDADIVMFLYRDAYYHPEKANPTEAECIVAKNRHGETGRIMLHWNGHFTKFSAMEHRYG